MTVSGKIAGVKVVVLTMRVQPVTVEIKCIFCAHCLVINSVTFCFNAVVTLFHEKTEKTSIHLRKYSA